jgi:hypothetical protein
MLKKIIVGGAIVGVGVTVAYKLAQRYGVVEKMADGYNQLVEKVVDVAADALTRYDEWTTNLVGDGENAPRGNSEQAAGHQDYHTEHDFKGAGLR